MRPESYISLATPTNSRSVELDSDDLFDVRELTLEDGLSTLFSIDIVAVSSNPAVDFEEIVGKQATFRIRGGERVEGAAASQWSGIISEIHQLRSEDAGLSTYHLTIVPRLWLLTQRTNCRVFQQMTDLDVVRALLGERGSSTPYRPEAVTPTPNISGVECARMRAKRDIATRVNRDHEISVGNDRRATIDGHDREQVEKNQNGRHGGRRAESPWARR